MRLPKLQDTAFASDIAADRGFLPAFAVCALVVLPLALLFARAFGDAVLSYIAFAFATRQWLIRDWAWLRAPSNMLMLAFWVWMLACTLIYMDGGAIVQAIVSIRFYLFVAALDTWLLASARVRKSLWIVVLGCALWILVETWQQYLLGANLFGYPRWLDGALTGPFRGPVAGPMFLSVFFPAFLPLGFILLRRPNWRGRALGIAALMIPAITMILIGQRMPAVLMAFGLLVSGLLFRQFRWPVAVTIGVAVLILAALPIISPPTFAKLVVHFTQQMDHFWATPYGLIFARAATMIQAHPWIGLGWDGYRDNCMNKLYLTGLAWLPVSDPTSIAGCNIHPHNYWLQIATSCGLPGVMLFAALTMHWLWRILGSGVRPQNDRRSALLVTVLVMLWPIASTTSLFTLPNGGWVFLMIGWGLAEARWSLSAGSSQPHIAASPEIAAGPAAAASARVH